MIDILRLTIKEALAGLRKQEFSAEELTLASLKQIEKYDKKLKAFITVCKNEALDKAREADKIIAKERNIFDRKPLFAIPYSAKDVFCTKGVKSTGSSQILKGFMPQYNATVIDRLDQAGAILIGKTNCDPFGFGSSTENSGFQTSRNPWNSKKVPGGSSGGSAAAVASGMGLFSIAEDTGGSIRQPASFCSVSGLKVSYGRVSRYGVMAYASSLDTIGPIGKSVYDLVLVLSIIAGKDEMDASSLQEIDNKYKEALSPKRADFKKKVGIPKEYLGEGIDPQIKQAVLQAGKVFEKMGCRLSMVSLPNTKYAIAAYYLIAMSEVSANLARYDGIRFGRGREYFEPEVKRRIMLGTYALSSGYFDEYYKKALKVRTLLKKDFDNVFSRVDLLIAPVSPTLPFDIGEKTNDPLAMWLADAYTVTINPAGVPSLALPCGFSKDNLPLGMQIIGQQKSEKLLFEAGTKFQTETNWHTKHPDLENL